MTGERENSAGARRKADTTNTAKPSRLAFDPSEISKSPTLLRKLFKDAAIWKAFEYERSRRDIEDRARRIEEMERKVAVGDATRDEHIRLNVAKGFQEFFANLAERENKDVVGPTIGTA